MYGLKDGGPSGEIKVLAIFPIRLIFPNWDFLCLGISDRLKGIPLIPP